jgi:hypothetical protein
MLVLSLIMMFAGFGFYVVALNFSITAFRRLVDYQYQNHKDKWEADGRPRGGKITHKELSFFGSDFASSLCSISWAVRRPDWLSAGSFVEKFRIDMIRWFFISFIGFFIFAGGMVVFGLTLKSIG